MQDVTTNISINEIIDRQLVTPVYQPIVDLQTLEPVAYEALARGPVGTDLALPGDLFDAADRAGRRFDLDWECRAAALRGALAAGMGRESCLFINVEASSFGHPVPVHLGTEIEAASVRLNVVAEITERDLVDDPASLIYELSGLRGMGFGLAVDDLGVNPESLALLPFLKPDIIKLDMSLVQDPMNDSIAATSAAVRNDAERRGTLIIAEGIETEEHVDRARVLGAGLGQGWLFARPGPLPTRPSTAVDASSIWRRLSRQAQPIPHSPWELVADWESVQTAPKRVLLHMSENVERHAIRTDDRPIVMSAFQHARNFTPATARRYQSLAKASVFVGVVGTDMPTSVAPGIRGGRVGAHHPVADEWVVLNVGPHYAAGLIARDVGDEGPDAERRFDYVITHDRETVVAAAASLLQLIEPVSTQVH